MTRESFLRHIDEARAGMDRFVLPVYRRLSADLLTPVSAYLRLRASSPFGFLFESVEGGEKLARYSFLGTDPYRIIRAEGRKTEIEERRRPGTRQQIDRVADGNGDIFTVLADQMSRYDQVEMPELPRLTGGAVGYLGYDGVRLIEHLPDAPPDDLELPDATWCFYDTVVAFDHVRHQLVLVADTFIEPETNLDQAFERASDRLDNLERILSTPPKDAPAPVSLRSTAMASNFKKEDFFAAVETAKQYIYEGDIFQVVLSQRFAMPFTGDRFNLYRALRQVNPSPYLFYLDLQDTALIGSSPEVLVRVEDDRAEVLPIAGTRPRGATDAEDKALEDELLADPKERAEHLMLVDLGRNDLGRVCHYNSVHVDRYAYIERYSHVMHIVSSVSGQLDDQHAPLDVLKACFPAGTVSGAPKVRAMEIIDELEPTRRGVYAGAVGYVDFSGTLDTCIAIRTMVVQGNTAYVQAGAGIVADSIPENEYEETYNKARALQQAILMAADGLL